MDPVLLDARALTRYRSPVAPEHPRFLCRLHRDPKPVEMEDDGWFAGRRVPNEPPPGTPIGFCDDCQHCFPTEELRRTIADRIALGAKWLFISIPDKETAHSPEKEREILEAGYKTLCKCHFKKFAGTYRLLLVYLRSPTGAEVFHAGCGGPCGEMFAERYRDPADPTHADKFSPYASEVMRAQLLLGGRGGTGMFGEDLDQMIIIGPRPPSKPTPSALWARSVPKEGDRVRIRKHRGGYRRGTLWGDPLHIGGPVVIWDDAPDDLFVIYLDAPELIPPGQDHD